MKKKFTFLIAAVMLLMMMSLPGKAVGQTRGEAVAYTLTPANGSNNSYTGNCDITISGITWNLTGNSQQIPWRIGGKSLSGVDRSLYSKTAISDNITKIEVTHGTASGITVNSWTVIVASNASFTNVVSTLTPAFAANTTTTITRPDGVNWRNCYFKFVYNVTVSGSNNKFLEFSEAKFYKGTSNVAMASVDNVDLSATYSGGSLSEGNNANIDQGAQVTLAANATTGYVFSSWVITKQIDDSNVTASVLSGNTLTVPAYDINISATISQAQQYTITFNAGSGTCSTSSQNYYEGTVITEFPTATPSPACSESGYTFDGWSETSVADGSANYTKLTSYTVSGDAELYAVYKLTEVSPVNTTNVFSNGSYSNSTITWAISGVVSILQERNGNANTAPNSSYVNSPRWYTGNKITISTSVFINSITVIATSDSYATALGNSTYTNATASVSSSTVTITPINGNNNITIVMTGQSRLSSLIVNYDNVTSTFATAPTPQVATPVLSKGTDYYVGTQSVTITCETPEANIYYTLDGTDPSNASTLYNGAISISENKTLKAIAIKSGYSNSDIASATYTILTPLTTMQDVFDANTTAIAKKVAITFGNWVITGNNNSSNPTKAWLTDNNGKGCFLSVSSGTIGFVANNVLTGTVICDLVRSGTSGAQIQGVTSSTSDINGNGIVDSDPGNVTVVEDAVISALTGVNTGSVVQINNLTCTSANTSTKTYVLTDVNSNTITAKNTVFSTLVLEVGKKYNLIGIYELSYGTKIIYPRSAADIEEVVAAIAVSPTEMSFTYVHGGSAANQTLTISGANLAENISGTLTGSDFSISDDGGTTWNKTAFTINKDDGGSILVRLNPGLDISNDYSGSITLSSTGASNVVVGLTGSVTTPTHALALYPTPAGHGTITFSPVSPVAEGSTVSLTAIPDTGYDFGEWRIYKKVNEEYVLDDIVSVANNQFSMPTYDIWVDATFTAKPTYGITCAVTPNEAADLEALPASAYEGQTVTLSYIVDNDYYLSSIVITKTSDGTATGITTETSGNDYTFTMPGYAVTVSATFISKTFEGNFVLFTGAMTEGDYILVYNNKAMTNTVTSNKFDVTSVTPSGNVITNPSRNIVWHIAPSATQGYWTIKNEKVNQYANQTGNASGSGNTNVSLVDSPYDGAKWSHVSNSSYDFRSKLNEGQTTVRYLRDNGSGFGTYATENSGSLTLYKYTALTPVTITFNGHGGTYNEATTYTQEVYSGIEATLNSNQFVRSGYGFARWSTEEGGGGTTYNDGANITIASNTTLYAQWATAYTASVANDIEGGTVKIIVGGNQLNSYETVAGVEITLSATPSDSYRFSAWNVKDSDNVTITVTDNKFTMPAKNVTISATFEEITTYSLVQSQAQLIPGKHYIIVGSNAAGTNYYAMGAKTSNYMSIVSVTKTNNKIQETDGVCEFVISGDATHGWSFYDKSSGKYLKAVNGNELDQTGTLLTEYCYWTIDFEAEAVEFIQSNKYTDRFINFNLTNTRFANYKTSSNMQPVKLYMKDGDTDLELYSETKLSTEVSCTTCSFGNANGKLTIANNGILNCSGTITGATTSNLIIEDGGQLITKNAVQATVKKTVASHDGSANAGWTFIAMPITNSGVAPGEVSNMINVDAKKYDLYRFNEGANPGWENYKQEGDHQHFNLEHGRGYLYANQDGAALSFAGTVNPGTSPAYNTYTVNLDFTSAENGWNLVGNPFTCNATVDRPCFIISGNSVVATDATIIAPGKGVMVRATAANQTVTFTKTTSAAEMSNGHNAIEMTLAQNVITRGESSSQTLDNAIVSFNEDSQLGKFYFGTQDANLYIPMDNEEYAIVSSSAQGEMPVNFRACVTGEYTITVNPQEVEMGYLHLIDNIAGVDVDLLANPSYTFNARYDDYESRFRLVFSANMVNADLNDDFAFFSNGQLVIANEGEAILQVIDVNGRIVATESINGTCSKAINAKAGVYVLRLINGTDVKTQKIIVK